MVQEDNNLSIILFRESRQYNEKLASLLEKGRNPSNLHGTYFLDDDSIECYIDNIAVSKYGSVVRENEDLIKFADSGIVGSEFARKLEDHIDKELNYRIKKNIDLIVVHELTHRLSGYPHPKSFYKLLESELSRARQAGSGDNTENKDVFVNDFDNPEAKKLLSARGIQSYTTRDFDRAIKRAVSWYSDSYL